jgi:hypothetical protein
VFATALLTARARPVFQNYGELDTDFSNALAEMLAGKVTVAAGLAAATTAANSTFKQ